MEQELGRTVTTSLYEDENTLVRGGEPEEGWGEAGGGGPGGLGLGVRATSGGQMQPDAATQTGDGQVGAHVYGTQGNTCTGPGEHVY